MEWHATHRNVFAQMLATFGERDAERAGCFHRVIEE